MRSIDFTVYIEEAPAISSYTDICGTHHICICICSPLKCIHSCRQACIIKVPQMHLHKWHFIMRAQALHLRMPEMSFPFLHAPQLIASAVMIQPLRSTKLSSKQRPIEGKNKCLTNTPTSWVLKKEDIWKKKNCSRWQVTEHRQKSLQALPSVPTSDSSSTSKGILDGNLYMA